MITPPKIQAACNTCTIQLVACAYQKAPWFRLVREPLRLAMCFMAWAYRGDPSRYEVRTPACLGCPRFLKVGLKEKSALFRWLNDRVNPYYDRMLERIVPREEHEHSLDYARRGSRGELPPGEIAPWLNPSPVKDNCINRPHLRRRTTP